MYVCVACELEFSSQQQYDRHVRTEDHRRACIENNLTELLPPAASIEQSTSIVSSVKKRFVSSRLEGYGNSGNERESDVFLCDTEDCGVSATRAHSLQRHAGEKHPRKLPRFDFMSSATTPTSADLLTKSWKSDTALSLPPISTGFSTTTTSPALDRPSVTRGATVAAADCAPARMGGLLFCEVCNVPATSAENLQQHFDGQKHKKKMKQTMASAVYSSSVLTTPCSQQFRGLSSLSNFGGFATERRRAVQSNVSHDELKIKPKTLLPQPTVQELRPYQRELYRQCMESNRVVYLPTGMGKTLVGAAVLSHMLQLNPKRQVIFIVDRVLLVLQQSVYLREQLGRVTIAGHRVRVAGLCGDKRKLEAGMPPGSERQHDVVVATAGCYLNLLSDGTLSWTDVACLVLDEAHHCGKKHPFNELVRNYYDNMAPSDKPRLVGLTASPVGELTLDGTRRKLLQLLERMDAELSAVVDNRQSYEEHLKRAQLRCVVVDEDDVTDDVLAEGTTGVCSDGSTFRNLSMHRSTGDGALTPDHKRPVIVSLSRYLRNLMPHNSRCSANLLEEIEMPDIKASFFHAYVADLFLLVTQLLEAQFAGETSYVYLLHLQIVTQGWLDVRAGLGCGELYKLCGDETPFSFNQLRKNHDLPSCRELVALLHRSHEQSLTHRPAAKVEKMEMNYPAMASIPAMIALPAEKQGKEEREETTSVGGELLALTARDREVITLLLELPWKDRPVALVLVQLRNEAHHLCSVLNRSSALRKKRVSSLAIVGQGAGGTGEGMTVHQQDEALKALHSGRCNVAVCTSVAEEGLDLPACSLVIQTRPPPHVTSLVQAWGRARARSATFVVICYVEDQRQELMNLLDREKNMEIVAKEMMSKQPQRLSYSKW